MDTVGSTKFYDLLFFILIYALFWLVGFLTLKYNWPRARTILLVIIAMCIPPLGFIIMTISR